jgi:hypothetical protein
MSLTFEDILRLEKRINELETQLRDRREELRGIFAIGTIATTLGFLSFCSISKEWCTPLAYYAPIETALYLIAYTWGFYVFAMTIGVSEDYLGKGLADFFRLLGKWFFKGRLA